MKTFYLTVCLFLLTAVSLSQASAATPAGTNPRPVTRATTLSPQAIRQMPLLERPNRPGHFYGNTVRALNYGRRGRR